MPRSTDEDNDQRPVVTIANQNRSAFVDPFTFHMEIALMFYRYRKYQRGTWSRSAHTSSTLRN